MKRSLTILLFILSVLTVKAQLAPVGTKWTYDCSDMAGSCGGRRFSILKDTLMDSTIYSCIGFTGSNKIQSYWASENNKLYYYFNSKKRLFFDFNRKQNDTLFVDKLEYYKYINTIRVDTLIENYPIIIARVYYYKTSPYDSLLSYEIYSPLKGNSWPNNNVISPKLIFGPGAIINNSFFQFENYIIRNNITDVSTQFRCYEEPSGYILKYPENVDCAKVGIEEIHNYEKSISVYPNPSSGTFQIELKNNINPTQLLIYDEKGNLVERKSLSRNSTSFQFDAKQKSGQYYIVFELENNVRVVKRIIIE